MFAQIDIFDHFDDFAYWLKALLHLHKGECDDKCGGSPLNAC